MNLFSEEKTVCVRYRNQLKRLNVRGFDISGERKWRERSIFLFCMFLEILMEEETVKASNKGVLIKHSERKASREYEDEAPAALKSETDGKRTQKTAARRSIDFNLNPQRDFSSDSIFNIKLA